MANNELSGPVVLNAILDYIKKAHPERKYTYRFVLLPETIGSIAYLSRYFEELKGIDFKKGCYVGQENTARIKHKNKLSKRILPFTLLEGNIDNGVLRVNNTEIGKVLINNSKPFALIKIKEKEFEFDKELNCENAKVLFKKPQWLSII